MRNKPHSAFLGKVRNYVGAHRDHNASAQLEVMSDFRTIDVYKLGAEFSEPLRNLVDFYIQLFTYIHSPAVMLYQVAKAISQPNSALNSDAPTSGAPVS